MKKFKSGPPFVLANFLFVSDTILYEIDSKVDIIGNVRELPDLLDLVGNSYNPSIYLQGIMLQKRLTCK